MNDEFAMQMLQQTIITIQTKENKIITNEKRVDEDENVCVPCNEHRRDEQPLQYRPTLSQVVSLLLPPLRLKKQNKTISFTVD
jgi:hypothetical protein